MDHESRGRHVRDPDEARKVVEALLDGPATFTPIETPDGRRYKVAGRIATGALLQALPDPQRERPQGELQFTDGLRTILRPEAAPVLEMAYVA